MPRKCVVPGCRGNYTKEESVSAFTFPRDSDKRELWIRHIKRVDFQPTSNSVVCERHFREEFLIRFDSVTRPDGSTLTVKRGIAKLSNGAYPSLCLEFPTHVRNNKSSAQPKTTFPQKKGKRSRLKKKKGGCINESPDTGSLKLEIEECGPDYEGTLEVKCKEGHSKFVLEKTHKSLTANRGKPSKGSKVSVLSGRTQSVTASILRTSTESEAVSIPSSSTESDAVNTNAGGKPSSSSDLTASPFSIEVFKKPYLDGITRTDKRENCVLGELTNVEHVFQVNSGLQAADVQTGENGYKCPHCDRSFSKSRSLQLHQRVHKHKPYKCLDCDKAFATLTALQRHQADLVNADQDFLTANQQTGTGNKPYRCTVCGKRFTSLCSMKKHRKLCMGKLLTLRCSICDKAFRLSYALKKHIQICKGKKHCTHCGKVFECATKFKAHQTIHTGYKKYLCTECGKAFRLQCVFRRHQRVHTGYKPFLCTSCGKKFSRMDYFRNHRCSRFKSILKLQKDSLGLENHTVHTGYKQYMCIHCGKVFECASKLEEHQTIHTGYKKYLCTECGKEFRLQCVFRRHQRVHTGYKPYLCTSCGKKFSRMDCFRNHRCSRLKSNFKLKDSLDNPKD